MKTAKIQPSEAPHRSIFAKEVDEGFSSNPKYLPTRFIYDDRGSRLFADIMNLPEYYPARAEKECLSTYKSNIATFLNGKDWNLVELGAGNGEKTLILIEELLNHQVTFSYIPVDISGEALRLLSDKVLKAFPDIDLNSKECDYFEGLHSLDNQRPNLVLFMGGNIGNFEPSPRAVFLNSLSTELKTGDLVLIGFDLKKDIGTLTSAYNDTQGVTRDFNKNILYRINRELQGSFDPEDFYFYSTYNPHSGAVESFLLSRKEQQVFIGETGKTYHFAPYEPIHTESSFKFNKADTQVLAGRAGFREVEQFTDPAERFVNVLWKKQ